MKQCVNDGTLVSLGHELPNNLLPNILYSRLHSLLYLT